jgi:hypothetical protein
MMQDQLRKNIKFFLLLFGFLFPVQLSIFILLEIFLKFTEIGLFHLGTIFMILKLTKILNQVIFFINLHILFYNLLINVFLF